MPTWMTQAAADRSREAASAPLPRDERESLRLGQASWLDLLGCVRRAEAFLVEQDPEPCCA